MFSDNGQNYENLQLHPKNQQGLTMIMQKYSFTDLFLRWTQMPPSYFGCLNA
jgi:hypothetical protein